jgi:hypothetical protein
MEDDQRCIDPRLLSQRDSPANASFNEAPLSNAENSRLSNTYPWASPIDHHVDPSRWNEPIAEASTHETDEIHPVDHGEWSDRIFAGSIFPSSDACRAFEQGQAPVGFSQRVIPLESNISESTAQKLRAQANLSSSKTISAETWQPLKNIVKSRYKSRNKPLKNLMNLLETRYEFHATWVSYVLFQAGSA